MEKKELLLGNEAIAGAVVAAGCQVATAYPGTPSSEILPAIARFADAQDAEIAVEWGANEKVAYEMAVSAAFAGARACCVMKHVGLNVAADPFMTTALYELEGGMLLIAADDPGPGPLADPRHSARQVLDPGQRRGQRQDEADDQRDRPGPHRRDVGEVLGRGARPDLLRARPAGGEVVALDQQVRAHAVAGVRGRQDGAVVAGADQLAPGARQQRGEGGQKLLLRQVRDGERAARSGALSG